MGGDTGRERLSCEPKSLAPRVPRVKASWVIFGGGERGHGKVERSWPKPTHSSLVYLYFCFLPYNFSNIPFLCNWQGPVYTKSQGMTSIKRLTAQTRGLAWYDLLYSQHRQKPLLCFSLILFFLPFNLTFHTATLVERADDVSAWVSPR